jgi:protein-disulfide isomerase
MSDLKAYSQARREGKEPEAKIELPPRKPEFSEELYKKLAGDLGLDVAKYAKDLKEQDAAFEKKIAEDVALAAKADVRGTPTFFLNGKKTRARDLAGFKAEIEKLLKK